MMRRGKAAAPICDFCSGDAPERFIIRSVPITIEMLGERETRAFDYSEDWVICRTCIAVLDEDGPEGVTLRSVNTIATAVGTPPHEHMAMIRELHSEVWAGWDGSVH